VLYDADMDLLLDFVHWYAVRYGHLVPREFIDEFLRGRCKNG
jgi:hypothetical protein